MNVEWVRIRSWHVVRLFSRGGQVKALCGRWARADAETSAELPAGKSCETCLRLMARSVDT